MEYEQGLPSSMDQPADAIIEGSASGLILSVEDLIVHHRLHRLAPAVGLGRVTAGADIHLVEPVFSGQ